MTDIAPDAGAEAPADDTSRPADEAELNSLFNSTSEAPAEGAGEPDDDSEEMEWEGAKYRAPKALRAAVEKATDYTKKTQQLAEDRKALEAERTGFAGVSADTIKALAKVQGIDERLSAVDARLAEYRKVDWETLRRQDPDAYEQHRGAQSDLREEAVSLRDERTQTANDLQTKGQETASIRQREDAKALEQANQVLSGSVKAEGGKDLSVKGWGPDVASKLGEFAGERYGFTAQELGAVRDPRLIKLLHDASEGARLMKTQAATEAAARAEKVQPTPKINRGGSAPGALRGDLSDAEFFKRAEAAISKH